MAQVSWNYTTYLNVVFLALAALLIWRYFRRGGGWAMLKMMNEPTITRITTTTNTPATRTPDRPQRRIGTATTPILS